MKQHLIALVFAGLGGGALAQTTLSFEEFQQKVLAGANEIAKYQQVLQNPDIRIQFEAVQYLLKSDNPALVRIAKEHALFSTNPVLRNSAIEAIFNAGGNLRIEVTSSGENSTGVLTWVERVGGTHDGRIGNFVFPISVKKGDCWLQFNNSKICQLKVAGTTVQYRHSYNSGQDGQATLQLAADGVLRGVMFANNGRANVAIDLKE